MHEHDRLPVDDRLPRTRLEAEEATRLERLRVLHTLAVLRARRHQEAFAV